MIRFIRTFLFTNTHEKQIVVKNTLWLVVGEITSRLFRFVLILYAARLLGANGWGIFSYALSAAGLLMSFSDLGLNMFITKEAVTKEKKVYLKSAFYLKTVLVILSLILAIAAGNLITTDPQARILLPITACILASDYIRDFITTLIRAREKMENEALFRIITNALIVGFGLALLFIHQSPLYLAYGYLIGSVFGTIITTVALRGEIFSFLKERTPIRFLPVLLATWPIAIINLSHNITFNLDTVMVGRWHTATDVGLYAADQRIVQFIYIIPALFIGALFPTMTRLFADNKKQFKYVLEESLMTLFLIACPIVFAGSVLSKEILTLLFGLTFTDGSTALILLLFSVLATFPVLLFGNVAIILNQQKKIAWIQLFGVCVAVVGNVILIPLLGIIGAAISMCISQLFIAVLIWKKVRSMTPFTVTLEILKIIAAAAIITGIAAILKSQGIHVGIIITAMTILYVILLVVFKEKTLRAITHTLRSSKL